MQRDVPLPVRARVLFGGALNQIGWFFLGFGMIFVWVFAPMADLSMLRLRRETVTVEGRVTATVQTRATVGGSRHQRGTPVYANHYTFERNPTLSAVGHSAYLLWLLGAA